MRLSLYFVELLVRDWQASVAWYRDVLRLEVVLSVEADRFALLSAGTARVALKQGEPHPAGVLLAFELERLDEWLTHLEARGVPLDGPVKASAAEGYRRVRLRDPDGHAVTLFDWARSIHDLTTEEAYHLVTEHFGHELPPQDAVENEDWGRDYVLQKLLEHDDEELVAVGLTRREVEDQPGGSGTG